LLISIVIPAYNRPALLLEAVHSIAKQSYSDFEVIVVDNGSAPPISKSALEDALGERLLLFRHDSALGVPKAKNVGVKLAHGEVILILDDDDLLMPDALERISYAFSSYPQIDCLFLGVHPFGPYAAGPTKSRDSALRTVLDKSNPQERDGLYFFSDRLFDALLETVPVDFQRPAARRGMWNIVGGFDEDCLFSESAWTIRASCIGTIAFSKRPLTQWRIHDGNFGWPSDLELDQIQKRQMDNGISAGAHLLKVFDSEKGAWRVRAAMIRRYQSDQLLSKAYYLRGSSWPEGARALVNSFLLAPRPLHLKLAAKYFLPLRWFDHMRRGKNNG